MSGDKQTRNTEIFNKYILGTSIKELANEYGMTRQRISQIIIDTGHAKKQKEEAASISTEIPLPTPVIPPPKPAIKKGKKKKSRKTLTPRQEILKTRNAEIRALYAEGARVEALAAKYHLSGERIRTICVPRTKKKDKNVGSEG